MRFWEIVRLALGGLRRSPLRVTLTALGVTIATGALVSMVGFALGMQAQAEIPFKVLGLLNNIEVSAPRKGASEEAPVLDDAALERMAELPGVEVAYPELRLADIEVVRGENTETSRAFALPREAMLLGVTQEVLVAGQIFSGGNAPEAIIGRQLAEKLGFSSPEEAVGTTVTLKAAGLSPEDEERFRFERREFRVTVVGVYDPPGMTRAFAGNGVLLPVELMKEIPGVRFSAARRRHRGQMNPGAKGYARGIVRARHPVDIPRIEKAIREMGFEARSMLSRLEEMRRFFVFIDVLLACVGTVALVVAGLGIVNTLLMSVLERYQEIGICKAIGASDGDLRVLFLTEAGIVGLAGSVGGLALGRVVSFLLEIAVNAYARNQGVTMDVSVFAFPVWLLAGAVLFSITISVLAGVYPATRASRVDPIRALRGE